jgi:hypothetical protein
LPEIDINAADLDPNLIQVGVLAGLLVPGTDAATYTLDTAWFSNPLAGISDIPSQRASQIISLLGSLLGGVAGNAVGTPDNTLSGNWYAIKNPVPDAQGNNEPTGIYLVTTGANSPPSSDAGESFLIGLGLMYPFTFGEVELTVYAYLPLIQLPSQGGSYFVLGSQPVELGLEVTGTGGPFGSGDVSFDGLKVAVRIDFTGGSLSKDITPEIVLLNLKLPGQQSPQNRSLLDLIEHGSIDEWITMAISVFAAQLSKAGSPASPPDEIGSMVYDVLALLGLTGSVPSFDWDGLYKDPQSIIELLTNWFRSIAASPSTLKTWLNDWYCLRYGISAADGSGDGNVTGMGTRAAPFAIQLSEIAGELSMYFTVATEVDAAGTLYVYPGLLVETKTINPLSLDTNLSPVDSRMEQLGVQGRASVELIELVIPALNQSPPNAAESPTVFPSFDISVVLLNGIDPALPLLDVEDPSAPSSPVAGPLSGNPRFRLGTVQIGFSYLEPALVESPVGSGTKSSRVFTPSFNLTGVDTLFGSWDVIDLTNFNQDLNILEDLITNIVKTALTDFLGGEAGSIANGLAVILGVAAPQYPNGTWPVSEMLINTTAALEALVSNPLAALGSYYTRCLTTLDDTGQPAWKYLLPYFAQVLGGKPGQLIPDDQKGTADQPWQVELLSFDAGPAVYLQAWQAGAQSPLVQNEICLALFFGVPITIQLSDAPPPLAQVDVNVGLQAQMLNLSLPGDDGSGSFGADWLPGVGAQLRVTGSTSGGAAPSPLKTPSLAGVSVQVDAAMVSTGWDRRQGFNWAAGIINAQLNYDGSSSITIPELDFSSGSLQQDVENLGELAQLVVNALGLWLMGHGGRFGTTLTAALGLLPTLPEIINGSSPPNRPFEIPAGLALPANWPTLSITDTASFFENPWTDIRNQLGQLFSQSEFAEPLMQLIGWAVTGLVPAAPAVAPAGTFDDPWSVTLTNAWNLEVLVWSEYDGSPQNNARPDRIGFGLQKVLLSADKILNGVDQSGVHMDSTLRVDVARLSVPSAVGQVNAASPPADAEPILPRFSMACNFTNTKSGAPLVQDPYTGLTIGSGQIGVYAELNPSTGLNVNPVVTLFDAQLTGSDAPAAVNLLQVINSPQGLQDLETLLNALMVELTEAIAPTAGEFPELEAVFQLLNDLGLAQTAPLTNSPPGSPPALVFTGINVGAWDALLSNPAAFFKTQMTGVLQDPALCPDFFKHLATLAGLEGFRLPPALEGLPSLLAAFGLMQTTASGYAVSLQAWLSLFEHPVEFLEEAGSNLLTSPAARQQLITALSNLPAPPVSPPFSQALSFSVTGGTTISLAIKEPISIGAELQITGAVVLNLQALTLGVDVVFSSEVVGAALAFHYTLSVDQSGNVQSSWGMALESPPNTLPAPFAPLVIYPLPDSASIEKYLLRLAEEIPLFILSSFAADMLNEYVLPKYPFAVNLFDAFGLTAVQSDGTARITSLLGIFMHPEEWVLSPQVLGDGNGRLDLYNVGRLLNKLPGTGLSGPGDITVRPAASGMLVSGLPYGVSIAFSSDDVNGVGISVEIEPAVSPPIPCVDITAGMSFGVGAGVAVTGDIKLAFDLSGTNTDACSPAAGDTVLTIESGYEKGWFALDLTADFGGQAYPVKLIPFGGLNQFIPNAQELDHLLNFVAGKLGDIYDEHKDQFPAELNAFISDLISFASDFNVNSIGDLINLVEEVTADPTAWLSSRFSPANVSATLKSIYTLLNDTLKIQGFTWADNTGESLIQYAHEIEALSPLGQSQVVVSFGNKTINDQAAFGIWIEPVVAKSWLILDATAGIALPLNGDTELDFTLEVDLGVDVESFQLPWNGQGPELDLGLSADTKGSFIYSLNFYPVGSSSTSSDGSLVIELLPSIEFGLQPDGSVQPLSAEDWLYKFAVQFLIPLVADIVIDTPAVGEFLNMGIGSPPTTTPGAILSNFGLLSASPDYKLADLPTAFTGMDATGIVEKLIFSALQVLSGIEIFGFPTSGGIYVAGTPNQPTNPAYTDYGIRVQLPDFQITSNSAASGNSSSSGTGTASAGVELMLQLGKWPTGDTSNDSWIGRAGGPTFTDEELGVTFYLLREHSPTDFKFNARLELVSVGMDFLRYGNQPLVNMGGFRLGGVEPRIYLSLDASDLGATQLGAAVRCDDIGIPLGPKLAGGANNSNPVAQNLLQSNSSNTNSSGGGPPSGTNGAQGTNAVNPVFSMAAAYVKHFDFQLYGGQAGDPTNTIWFPVQRTFGPINCQKIGVGWEQSKEDLFISFVGSVALAGLAVNLNDLSIGIPVTTPLDYDKYVFGLEGMNVTFNGGPVEIGGGLLESKGSPPNDYTEYTGDILIKVSTFSITGMGSYAVVSGHTSLFVFVMVNAPLGGPAFFFVTGICGGFGYNRRLILPSQNEVMSFPLIAGVTDPSVFGGRNPLEVLNEDVPPTIGEYWLAAGVQFTSFDLLQSIVLLVVEFGTEFEIALLGLSTLTLPKGAGDSALVYAELQLEVTFKPSTGLLAVTMTLTPNSYVIDKNCRLTGGFAFYVWFGGQYKGDFVVTLGGYSPFFTPPDYYPVEPRLGFNWPVSSEIKIQGGAYFALTPSCVMAGGALQATYQSGDLKAWFDAQADFLIAWNPFHYDIYISVNIGASYTLHLIVTKTVSIELGCSLHIWGPRLQGVVHVRWYIISFSISFGDGNSNPNQPTTIDQYCDFYNYFLNPQKQPCVPPPSNMFADLTAAPNAVAGSANTEQSVCTTTVAAGLLGQFDDPQMGKVWVVRADEFVLTTGTTIPATEVIYSGGGISADNVVQGATSLGIRPMGFTLISTPHTVSIQYLGTQTQPLDLARDWTPATGPSGVPANTSGVPAALWDTSPDNANPSPASKLMWGALIGVLGLSPNPAGPTTTPPPPIDLLLAFSFDPLPDRPLPLTGAGPAANPPVEEPDSLLIIEETIMDEAVVQYRDSVLSEVINLGTLVATGGRLDVMAATAAVTFTAPPMIGAVSEAYLTAEAIPGEVVRVESLKPSAPTAAEAPTARAHLRSMIRQYATPHRAAKGLASSARARLKTTAHVSGKAYHAAGLHATLHDRQLIGGHVSTEPDGEGPQHEMKLPAGTTLLWEIRHGAPADRFVIEFDGLLTVRVVTADRFHKVIADVAVGEGGSGSYELPGDTRYLSLTGFAPAENESGASPHVGWHSSSSLILVTPKVLLGEGVIIHPQSPVRVPAGRRSSDYGLLTGKSLALMNIVEAGGAEHRRGWIETIMPSTVRTFAVLLARDTKSANSPADIESRVSVQAALLIEDGATERVQFVGLSADEVLEDEAGAHLLYSVPNPELQARRASLRVRVQAGAGLVQEGFIGSVLQEGGDTRRAKSLRHEIKLNPRGVSRAGAEHQVTRLKLRA